MIKCANRAPAMAIVEQLTGKTCRFRSIVAFEVGETVEFDLALHGAPRIVVRGQITDRALHGPRTSCVLEIDATTSDVPEDILEAASMASRQARTRSSADVPTADGLTRTTIRVDLSARVSYTVDGGRPQDAVATNISVGGMLMRAPVQLAVGASLDVAFSLPSHAEPLRACARIVATQSEPGVVERRFNLAFHSLDPAVARAIERYVATVSTS